jgi:hypothetical protein
MNRITPDMVKAAGDLSARHAREQTEMRAKLTNEWVELLERQQQEARAMGAPAPAPLLVRTKPTRGNGARRQG